MKDKPGILKEMKMQREAASGNSVEIIMLQRQLEMVQDQQLAQEQKLNAMEAVQRALDSSLQEVATNLQELKSRVQGPGKNGALADKELAEKIEKIEASIKQAKAASATVATASKSSDEENAYTAAYLELKSGRYDESITSFLTFLQTYPEGDFSDQAYFWLSEAYLAKKMNKEAIDSLNRLVKAFPKSPKLPAALLKLGMTYEQNGQEKLAIATYRALLRDHAGSDSATAANRRLTILTSKTKE